jgi:phosphate transport system substrate-binding protein
MWLLQLVACGGGPVVLQDKGSDTMVSLMQKLSENYLTVKPTVVVAVTGGGSGTGIKSLLDGTTDMANSSRPIKGEEIELAKKNGIDPVENVIAFDGLAIYVHKDNPIAAMSFEDLKCVYSADGACKTWADLGAPLDCGEIQKVGRQNNSGTYEYFREEVLGKEGKFTNTMDQSGTQQVVDVVATQKCAIGYGGMGYHNPDARFVCLSREKGAPCTVPTIEKVKSKEYDFSRKLFVYTNGAPTGEVGAFLDWAKSAVGQKIVLDAGFVPL